LKATHLKQGADAENACCNYLKSRGLKLIDKNFSCRQGEIDIIMTDRKTLVFVEVRFRKNNNFGGGLESVTPAKQNKLRKTAELYLQQNRQHENARFDVDTFEWITNAF
jgi:putative endonuclease